MKLEEYYIFEKIEIETEKAESAQTESVNIAPARQDRNS